MNLDDPVDTVGTALTGLVAIFVFMTQAPEYVGLEGTLIVAAGVLVAINIYYTHHVRGIVLNRVDDIESTVEEEARATREAVEETGPIDRDESRTDGSGRWQPVIGLKAEKVDASAIPAIAGGLLGGMVGAPFGPVAAGAGVVLGAALFGGKQYNSLKEEHRKRLDRLAWAALQQMSGNNKWAADLEEVNDKRADGDGFWVYRFRDHIGADHYVRISKSTGDVEYRMGTDHFIQGGR